MCDPLGDAIAHAVSIAIADAESDAIANGYTITNPNGRTVCLTYPNGYRAGYILSDPDDDTTASGDVHRTARSRAAHER